MHGKRNLEELFDIPLIYTDRNAIDFDERYTQGPDTVIVPRSYFHDSSDGQNQETCPTSDTPVVHPSNLKPNGQNRDIESTRDLAHNDRSQQKPEQSTDTETAYEPMSQPASRLSDNPSTLEINYPTTELI